MTSPQRHAARSNSVAAAGGRRFQPADRFTMLVIDPDPVARQSLAGLLRRSGVELLCCADAAEGLFLAGRRAPGLVVVSAVLPDVSACAVTKVIRAFDDVPVVLSVADGQTELVGDALLAGASEVFGKPFREPEIRSVLDRLVAEFEERSRQLSQVTVGGVQLDGAGMQVTVHGQPLSLTLREFELLQLLMVNAGRVVTHEDIRGQVWRARGEDVAVQTVKVHAHRLRRRVAGAADLVSVRGVGYRISAPPA